MEADKIPHENIERYLLNRMEDHELRAFEQQMAGSGPLRQEVAFQQQIIKGIGEARKMQLKARLAEIPVTSAPASLAHNSAWVKVVSGVMVVTTAAVLIYKSFEEDKTQAFDYLFDQQPVAELSIEENEAPRIPPLIREYEKAPVDGIVEPMPVESKKKEEKVINSEKVATQPDKIKEVPVPEVSIPVPGSVYEENPTEKEPLPLVQEGHERTVSFNVEQYPGERKYRYFDGELTLRGDFEGITYELLEIHDKEGKRYFIQVEGTYYALPASDTFRPFRKVRNRALIRELESLRDSR